MNVADDKPLKSPAVSKKLARIPPPPAFALPLIVGLLIGQRVPLPMVPPSLRSILEAVGLTLLGLGIALAGTCVAQFARRRTTIVPHRQVRMLVTSGPYRMTRNPMYVSLTAIYLGVAALTNALWPLLLLPAPLLLVAMIHIPFEERTLDEAFGEEYRRYAARVRRWL